MTLFLQQPFWLIFVLGLIPVFLYWRRGLTHHAAWRKGVLLLVETALLLALTMVLTQPVVTWKNFAKYVVCAFDVSGSAGGKNAWNFQNAEEFPAPLKEAKSKDRCVYLPFAKSVGTVRPTVGEVNAEDCDNGATNLAAVVTSAVALAPEDHVPEVVLYTDGTYNQGMEPSCAARNVRFSIVQKKPAGSNGNPETWLERVEAPVAAYSGEVVPLDVFVHTTDAVGQIQIELQRNGSVLETQPLVFEKPGVRGVRFQATVAPKAEGSGDSAHAITQWDIRLKLTEAQNQQTENDAVSVVTRIVPPRRILVVERDSNLGARVADVMKREFIEVETCSPEQIPTDAETLRKYGLLIMTNIPSFRISPESMNAVEKYVHDFGGGLIFIGGDQSFTTGGYKGTPIENILPVYCDEKKETQRQGLGLVLVVDRSESMKQGDAIGLAREAVKRALKVLGPQDQVGVLVFADTSGWLVPIRPLTDQNRDAAFASLDKLTALSVTNMAPAMEKAYRALLELSAERKHLIVMTDGVSNPGDFGALAQKIHEDGITISTIALGKEAEPNVLADIAKIGHGNAYVCTDPESMPQIFAAETALAAQVGIVEGQTPIRQISSIPGFLNFDFTKLPPLLGYIQTQAKPGSRVIFESPSGDPLLCWWKAGRGKVVAFTSDMESHWVETWSRGWDDFARFWGRLVSHAMQPASNVQLNARYEFQDEWLCLMLDVPPEETLRKAPEWMLNGEKAEPLRHVAPGLWASRQKIDLHRQYDIHLQADAESGAFEWDAVTVPTFTNEYRPDRQQDAMTALNQIVKETAGKINPKPAEIFTAAAEPQESRLFVLQTLPFWRWFLGLAMVLWMVSLGLRRA